MLLRKNPLLGKYLGLGWISCIGDALYYIALMTYAASSDNPGLGILIITISSTLPQLFNVILGALADSIKSKTHRIIQSGVFRGLIFILIAFIIRETNALWGLLVIGLLNAMSDTAGSFSALLKTPFMRLISKDEELEQGIGIDQSVRGAIDGIAGFFGVLLLSFLGIYYLAFFNAFLFFLVAFGFKLLSRTFKSIEQKIEPPQIVSINDFNAHIQHSIKTLINIKPLRNFFLVGAAMNAILATAVPVMLMMLADNPSSWVLNFELSVTIGKAGLLGVGIFAGLAGPKYCKKIGTSAALLMAMTGMLLFTLIIWTGFVWVAFAALFFSMFAATMFSIRLNSFLLQAVPLETLGTISGAIGLFLSILPIPFAIMLNSLAAFSIAVYSMAGAVLIVFVIILILVMKFDKMDLKETIMSLNKGL